MTPRFLLLLIVLLAACGSKAAAPHTSTGVAGPGASTTQVSGGNDVSRALDAYAAELARGVKVRCGLCWRQLGHASESACHTETDSDLLDDSHRACFEALGKTHDAALTLYLQCQTAASSWYSDCFAMDCDLRRCAMAHATWMPPAECATAMGDDAGAEPVTGVDECSPTTGGF